MADDNVKHLVVQALAALKAGCEEASRATAEISRDATHPDVKSSLEAGHRRTSGTWAERLDRARREFGGESGEHDNPIVKAHFEVARRIRQHAPDDKSRDLGIIADAQLALHYWIAAFSTVANYARHTGKEDIARELKSCSDEAKQADEGNTALAERLLHQA